MVGSVMRDEDLQQGGFAGAVAADHADDISRRSLEGNILQGPDVLRLGGWLELEGVHQRLAQRSVGRFVRADAILFAHSFDMDDRFHAPLLPLRLAEVRDNSCERKPVRHQEGYRFFQTVLANGGAILHNQGTLVFRDNGFVWNRSDHKLGGVRMIFIMMTHWLA